MESYFQMPVFQIMNITDVDDKIISKARALKIDSIQVARLRFYNYYWLFTIYYKKILSMS